MLISAKKVMEKNFPNEISQETNAYISPVQNLIACTTIKNIFHIVGSGTKPHVYKLTCFCHFFNKQNSGIHGFRPNNFDHGR